MSRTRASGTDQPAGQSSSTETVAPDVATVTRDQVPALQPDPQDRAPRKRRRASRSEVEAKRQAEMQEQAAAMAQRIDKARPVCRTLVAALTPTLATWLPPPLTDAEQSALVEGWTPLMAEHGDLPPVAGAIIITIAVLGPRAWAAYQSRTSDHGTPDTGPGPARDRQD